MLLIGISSGFALQPDDKRYSTRKIKQLVEDLPISSVPARDSLVQIPKLIEGKSVIFRFDETGSLSHIGVSLFSQETKKLIGNQLCDFIERFFLELCEQNGSESIKSKLLEYGVKLTYDGKEYGNAGFVSISRILNELDMPASFSLNLQEKQGQGTWFYGNHTLEMTFPLYRELIEGTDKSESDEKLYVMISETISIPACNEESNIDDRELSPYQNGIFVKKGERFQVMALSSDRYYVKDDEKYVPLFSEKYPLQSMNNLFLTCKHSERVSLQITHRQYGHFTPEVTVSLLSFLSLFQEDFTRLAHTGFDKVGKMETIVVFNHKTLNYIHMLRVKASQQDVFSKRPVLKADLYTNIPQHYLKTLLQ